MTSIHLRDVGKSYEGEAGERKPVLSNLSLEIEDGGFTTLLGPNGSGKTTLLNLIAGTVAPDTGDVEIHVDHGERPRVGYVWQNYRASLLPWFDVAENIAFPLRIQGVPKHDRRRVVEELLRKFSIPIRPTTRVYELSGGQQQLVSLFRSLVVKPDFLLLDEPFSALDQQTRWNMAFHVERIWMQNRVPTIFVSHDVDEAVMLADRILLLSKVTGNVSHAILNPLPRPRDVRMMTAVEHLRCRAEVLEFLFEQGAVRVTGDRESQWLKT